MTAVEGDTAFWESYCRLSAVLEPGRALDDFAASEGRAVETPVEPMDPRRSVEGAALALADAESAALEAPAQRSPQRSPARAPRSSVAGAPLALGAVDPAATYSSDDEARPAPTEEPAYADDDAASPITFIGPPRTSLRSAEPRKPSGPVGSGVP